jgi:hypothetical protein
MARPQPPAPVREALRTGVRTVGRSTWRARMLPTVLIVGAQRCGTTSLFQALAQHPAVVRPLLHKGVHYFDETYDRPPAWYRGHFPVSALARLRTRGQRGAPVTLESSPYYMHHPLAPERIARDLPDARLLVLVRDPVERAWSAHKHETARGFESEPFERAIELEPQRLDGEVERLRSDPGYRSFAHQHHAYVARGRYAEQLEALHAAVGRERVHVLDSEDFFSRPEETYAGVLSFLDLPLVMPARFERHNARPSAGMPADVRSRLEAALRPHDDALAALLGRPLAWQRPAREP